MDLTKESYIKLESFQIGFKERCSTYSCKMLEEKYQKIVSVAFPSTGYWSSLLSGDLGAYYQANCHSYRFRWKVMVERRKNPKNPLKIWKNPQIWSQNQRIFRSEKTSYAFSWSDTPLVSSFNVSCMQLAKLPWSNLQVWTWDKMDKKLVFLWTSEILAMFVGLNAQGNQYSPFCLLPFIFWTLRSFFDTAYNTTTAV